jgi:multidrug efflux pump subunit AcrB
MKKIIDFFIKRPVWGNALIALVVMFGMYSVFNTKRSFFPELDPNTIVVSLMYPGASPKEMEEGVTIKIEQAVKGLDDIEEINSTSNENFASVTIKGYTDADMDQLLTDVENAVNSINSFPQGAEKPIINRIKSGGMGSTVAFIGISSKLKNTNYQDLTALATKVERDLLNTKAITQIVKNGFPEREIAINVRENDLLRYGISMTEVSQAITQKNNDITAGLIRGGVQEMSIRSNNKGLTEDEISSIVIRTSTSGEIIHVGDVADVKLGYTENSQEARFNGKAAVSFQIEKTLDQDIAVISEELKKYQKQFNEENKDFQFNIFFEFNSMLNERIDLLTSNGISGLVLVLVFLGIFLNVKLSAWVAFGIPFSFLGMFILGAAYGITINMISLFGMILVVGILVDDGIVIAENIYSHFERGKSARQAAIDGTMEVLPSVFSSVITTIVAFSVLLYVEGLEMMREMAFVAISCLLFSLIEAFLILPAHLSHKSILNDEKKTKFKTWQGLILVLVGIAAVIFGGRLFPDEVSGIGVLLFPFGVLLSGAGLIFSGFSASPLEHIVRGGADRFIKYIRDNWFRTSIEMFVGTKRKWYRLSFFLPMIFTFLVIYLLKTGIIGFTFFPNIPPEFFNVEVAYSPGDSKAKTEAFIKEAQLVVVEENERIKQENGEELLTYFSSNIGATQNLGQQGNHTGVVSVFYKAEGKKTPVDTLKNRIIRRLKATPEVQLAKEFFVGGFGRFGADVEIGLSSANEANVIKAKEDLRASLEALDGLTNVKDNMPPGRTEVYINLLPQAEIYGLSKGDVLNQIRQAFFGQEAQRVIIGTDEVKIWVRYPPEERASLTNLENMRIKTAAGASIPLTEICTFELGRAPESLKRRDGERIVKIDAGALNSDSDSVINTFITNNIINKLQQVYPDVTFKRLGQFERSQKTSSSMQYVTLIALVIMFIIITLHFNSLSQAFLIMLVLPAGFMGGIMGHGLVGIPVSMLSLFGIIALLGVLVNDAIVFLDRYNQLLLEGMEPREAAIEASVSRFRAILLTSLTTVAGLLPIIGEKSMQAQFLIPMAVSIAFGVLFGTIFILFFFSSAILVWNGKSRRWRRLWAGERKTPREVEPVLTLHQSIHQSDHE